jgi:exopolysaccharide production protein ExoZ
MSHHRSYIASNMKKFQGIQALRLIAASLVVAGHQLGNIVNGWGATSLWQAHLAVQMGTIGVLVFFGISGFIMVTSQFDSFGKPGKALDFFWRRVLRILPLYAIATTLQFINKRHFSEDYTWLNYMKSLLFIPYVGEGHLYRPVVGQGWSLNAEMYFYLVFALSLLLPRARGLALSIVVILVTSAMQVFAPQLNEIVRFYANSILMYFVCGMLIGLLFKQSQRNTMSAPVLVAAWAAMLAADLWVNLSLTANAALACNLVIVFVFVWTAASYRPAHQSKFLHLIESFGDASYGTYLFHGFMLGALKIISTRIGLGQWSKVTLLVLFAVVLANLIGLVIHLSVEKPIARFLKPKRVPQPPSLDHAPQSQV